MRRRGSFWREEIVAALNAMGGRGALQDIYWWVERNGSLSEKDMSDWGGVGPMYQHTIRSYLTQMSREGLVVRTGKAEYRLSKVIQSG